MRNASKQLGPSYDEEKYWNEKFANNPDCFEWLGCGSVLLDAFHRAFPPSSNAPTPPRTLHLGAGTSKLSLDLARHYLSTYKPHNDNVSVLDSIRNVDFSQIALDIGEQQAHSEGLSGMQYRRIDLRDWIECQSLTSDGLMDFILDKSTSDAVSTNRLIELNSMQSRQCPLMQATDCTLVDPLDLVALHLAALSKPGCLWAVLSYSSCRFDILDSPHSHSKSHWKLVEKTSIPAPSGSHDSGAPATYHWYYLLQRQPV